MTAATQGSAGRRASMLALAAVAMVAVVAGVQSIDGMTREGRIALTAFGAAIVLWSASPFNPAHVAVAAAALVVSSGAVAPGAALEALGSPVIGLMAGAFVLGAAVHATGLATRLTGWLALRARNVGQMFWLATIALVPLALLIPSTSARAAVALPLFRTLSASIGDRGVSRALALLIPCIVLVTAICSLVGAGSHLIANDLLQQVSGERITFLAWLAFGLPFGVVAALACCACIQHLFLSPAQRRLGLPPIAGERQAWSAGERRVAAIAAAMLLGWVLSPWHGWGLAAVSLGGAALLVLPRLGAIGWRDAVAAVDWQLVVFLCAALILGRALTETDAASYLFGRLFAAAGLDAAGSAFGVLAALAAVTLTAHLYITSHAARAAALVPPLLAAATALGLDPAAVMFIGTVGMNFCLTFPVSSKALLMFHGLREGGFAAGDLFRLSAAMLAVHAVLMAGFYFAYWRWIGLALQPG